MKRLFPLILTVLFMCWSLALADLTPSRSSADVSYMPDFNTSNLTTSNKIDIATDLNSSDATKIHESKAGYVVDTKSGSNHRPIILTNYLFDDFSDGNYTSNPTWTNVSNGNGNGAEDWAIRTDPWDYTYGHVWNDSTGYMMGSDSDGGGALADEKLSVSFNTPGGGGQLTLYYWLHFRAYNGDAEYFRVLVDNNVVDSVQAQSGTNPPPVVGDRMAILDSYNDGNPHTLTMHYYADYGYVGNFDDVVITDDPRPLGSCCNDANGACVNNVEESQCPYPARWTANTLCADLIPPCGTTYGACCDDQGNCTQTAEPDCQGLWIANTPCDPNPCQVPPPCTLVCPPNGIPEGEPDCYDDYVDVTNIGCNADPPSGAVFTPIDIGDTVCGTAGTYVVGGNTNSRDTDWYRVVLTSDATLIWSGVAEFNLLLFIIDAGSEDCVDYQVLTSASGPACSTVVVTAPASPGVYYLWAGPAVFTGVPCGSPYIATVQTGAPPTGACCVGTDCVATNLPSECAALNGNWYIGETCPDFQCPIVVDCNGAVWDNGAPTGGAIGSQCDYDYPFAAETADDFVLPGVDPVTLQYVVAWVWFWNATPLATPGDMEGVNVTIYANDPANNSPGGKPLHPPDSACSHVDIIPDGVVYTTQIPLGSFGYLEDDVNVWRLMMPVNVTLDAGVTYWLGVEPILQPFGTYGQVGGVPSDIVQGAIAKQIFELLGTLVWTPNTQNADVAFCLLPAAGGGCDYAVGDVNGSGSYNGLDITYGVAFFKGGNPPQCPACPPCSGWNYCGDVNGSCNYNGLDITYGVAYFKGGAAPVPCADCPPNP